MTRHSDVAKVFSSSYSLMCQYAPINCVFTHSVPIGTFSPQNYTVHEGQVADLTIVLDRPSMQDTIFNVATMNLTATSE